ncbi:hypothetical protein [Rhodoglobus aureus]|uniref:Uncharacterized protein n=1 Tax=Rhodoglobus aureus TaxID=191497 RepID=A0ABN1VIN1_9MICO
MREALIEASPADIAVGGTADPAWLPEEIVATAANVISVPHANHSLTISGDWRASHDAQRSVFERIATHLDVPQA